VPTRAAAKRSQFPAAKQFTIRKMFDEMEKQIMRWSSRLPIIVTPWRDGGHQPGQTCHCEKRWPTPFTKCES
jgi:hypothetical protein